MKILERTPAGFYLELDGREACLISDPDSIVSIIAEKRPALPQLQWEKKLDIDGPNRVFLPNQVVVAFADFPPSVEIDWVLAETIGLVNPS